MFKHSALFQLLIVLILGSCGKSGSDNSTEILSPDQSIQVTVSLLGDNTPVYTVQRNGETVLDTSQLGVLRDDGDFTKNMKLLTVSNSELVEKSYTLKVGKKLDIETKANERTIRFENGNGQQMYVIFHVSNDGLAFRYFFPETSDEIKYILSEQTSFNFPDSSLAWLQPCADAKSSWARCNPSYEENYEMEIAVGTKSSTEAGWVFPALFKSGQNWVLISESGLDANYCATRLKADSPLGEYTIGFPQKAEVMNDGELNPESTLPWFSPWRVIVIGSLKTITESTLGTDMASPAIEGDFSWVKPGRASWSWVILKDGNTTYPVQKQFIDYASDMGWEYCLIDALWDTQIGYEKIKELADYATTKNVGLLLWYNSSGDWNDTPQTPKNMMVTSEKRQAEFQRIAEMGIKGVKIDFFGGDGQSVIQYYHEILQDAAAAKLMVNFHGCTLPRGWQRTYPHLVSMEAIKGMEFITFGQDNADKATTHCAMIPFARNVFDPMDFTPVCFSEIPNIQRHSTNGFELALSVLFFSGIQHYAETADGMTKVPAYVKEAMQVIPSTWDESIFIDGYPGKYVVMARRKGNNWYIAGINSEENAKTLTLDLSFLKGLKGSVITDGSEKRSFQHTEIMIPKNGRYEIQLKQYGGFLIQLAE